MLAGGGGGRKQKKIAHVSCRHLRNIINRYVTFSCRDSGLKSLAEGSSSGLELKAIPSLDVEGVDRKETGGIEGI